MSQIWQSNVSLQTTPNHNNPAQSNRFSGTRLFQESGPLVGASPKKTREQGGHVGGSQNLNRLRGMSYTC